MLATLSTLALWQVKNRLRVRLARLKEPRYLVGSVFGIAYIGYFAILRNPSFRGGRSAAAAANFAGAAGSIELGFAVVLLALAALVWIVPASRSPMHFSASEVQFLFPAPITRRELLQYRLLRSQAGILFGSVMATMFMRPGSLAGGWRIITGLWLALLTVRIYFTGVSLCREGLRQRGLDGVARWFPVVVAFGAVAIVASAAMWGWPSLRESASPRQFFETLGGLMSTPVIAAILWPFRALTRLPLTQTTAAYWTALPAAFAVLAANYVWVLRADTAFEEGAALTSEKRGGRRREEIQPRVRGVAATPFELAPTGRPEAAIVWKNLIMIGRYVSLRTMARLAPAVISLGLIASVVGRTSGFAAVAAGACFMLLGMTVLMGPMIARNDLRRDLRNLAMVKAWPLSGATLLRGEILAPAALLGGLAWLWILGAAALVGHLGGRVISELILSRISYAAAAMFVAPAIILAQLTVLNGLAVLFPAWVATGDTRARGVDAFGQRLFTIAGVLITLVFALVPGVLVAAVVAGGIYFVTGLLVVVLPAAVVAGVLVTECVVSVELLGRVLDRTDVSDISPDE